MELSPTGGRLIGKRAEDGAGLETHGSIGYLGMYEEKRAFGDVIRPASAFK